MAPAGLIEMPRLVFYGWTAVGTTVWVGLLTLAGYLLEERYTAIEGYIDPLSKPLLGLAALLVLWWIWRAWRR